MRLRDIDFTKIQSALMNVRLEAKKIRDDLGLGKLSVKHTQFFKLIGEKLNDMGFRIHYTNKLHNFEFNGQKLGHIPSLTIYTDKYKNECGGDIYIYDKYSLKKKRELLIHELVHIMDSDTPTWSTNIGDHYNVYMLSSHITRRIELITDLTAHELMMPNDDLQNDLFNCAYDINKIITDYRALETSTVIMWIVMHDYFLAHYAMLYQIKNKGGINGLSKIDEYSHADSKFDIANIVYNAGSIANKSWRARQSLSGESTIDERNYQCFCFYEKDVQQPLPSEVSPVEMIVNCDKMVIIGWSKHIYKFIQQLQFKQNSTSVKNP